MKRQYDLSGTWNFCLDAEKNGIAQGFFTQDLKDTIELPGTTALAKKGIPNEKREIEFLTEVYPFEGYAWFSRKVSIAPEEVGQHLELFMERTRITRLWVDGTYVGTFDSLTTPHVYDLTEYITKPEFTLTVMVSNTDYPTGGGHLTSKDTQTNWNGITGQIRLDVFAPVYLDDIIVTPDIKEKKVTVEAFLHGSVDGEQQIPMTVNAREMDVNGYTGVTTGEEIVYLSPGSVSFTYDMGDAALWSEYSPVFYQLTMEFAGTGERAVAYTGLREIAAEGMRFLVNGVETMLRGKHDGMIFPLTGAAPTDVPEWVRLMGISKEYGINHYRYHTCCPPEAAFIAADMLGIYMEPQLPFWGTLQAPGEEGYNEEEQEYLIAEGFRMMKWYGNHPSYCLMSLGNELWGNPQRMGEIIRGYKAVDTRHLYTQGSNNFQHFPTIIPEDDFYVGVRFSKNRLIRGSYGMCDAPLGHIQTDEPSTAHNYDIQILPSVVDESTMDNDGYIEIQYGTGVKRVKVEDGGGGLIPSIPVVTHEIGQFAVYPNFREIEKYTGVVRARNFEVFRERLEERGMGDLADDYFYCSGKLSVQCYKEELEAAHRSKYVSGYQILDIQDFCGQGTALVGILDAFMDSKGHVTKEEWAGFCSDAVLLAQFDKYIFTAGEPFLAYLAISYFNPTLSLNGSSLEWEMTMNGESFVKGSVPVPDDAFGLTQMGKLEMVMPEIKEVKKITLTLRLKEAGRENHYDLWLYPAEETVGSAAENEDLTETVAAMKSAGVAEGMEPVCITSDFAQAKDALSRGNRVLYLPQDVQDGVKGFYCSDFWCYPMFKSISESMGKEVPVGTMGLLIRNEHPALAEFLCEKYSTPQWYSIVTNSTLAVLDDVTDKSYRPIVQMIDNFERNHKLGLLFEGTVGEGRLMVCTSRLSDQLARPEVKQFMRSILHYMDSEQFAPEQKLDMDKLAQIFVEAGE